MKKEIEEKLKQEALRRMEALKLHDEGVHTCVGDFRKNGNVWKSEFHGILYWLDDDEKQIVKDFEEKYKEWNFKVYHCYKAHTEFGDILYMLYVSTNKEDTFAQFVKDLKSNTVYAYAYNCSEPIFSEFGSSYIRPIFGGIQLH